MSEKASVTGTDIMIAAAIIRGGGPNAGIIVLDKITGEVWVCSLRQCRTPPVER